MGGAVSTGQDNDELIDNLLEADYIRTPIVERVFRAVDRAEYFLHEFRNNAYKDLAWKNGNLHLSAPCIYSEVMEGLSLAPGLSFLNLGSGTGYLSTMVGLVVGSNGINHGVEIHEDVIQYANKKLDDFKKHSGAIDEYDFCEPKFIQGNCLCLSSDTRQYDRVYCGAACPEPHENYMKNLLKVGGILVMPLNDQLLQVKRTSETTWDDRSLLPVSFATLVQPPDGKQLMVQMMDVEPLPLQALCRSTIRNILRKNVDIECPNLKSVPAAKKAPKKKRALRRLVVPLFDTSDESSDEEREEQPRRNRDMGRANVATREGAGENNNQNRDVSTLIDFVLGQLRDRTHANRTTRRPDRTNRRYECRESYDENNDTIEEESDVDEDNAEPNASSEKSNKLTNSTDLSMEVEPKKTELEPQTSSKCDVLESDNCTGDKSQLGYADMEVDYSKSSKGNENIATNKFSAIGTSNVEAVIEPEPRNIREASAIETRFNAVFGDHRPETEDINDIHQAIVGVLNEIRFERGGLRENANEDIEEEPENNEETPSNNESVAGASSVKDSTVKSETKNKNKREKFDSGLGDEIIEKDSTYSPDTSDLDNVMELDTSSSSDENQEERPTKRILREKTGSGRAGGRWRRITLASPRFDSISSSENEMHQDEVKVPCNEIRTITSPYSAVMRGKIQELPLPPILKNYLNFYREF